MKDGTVARPTCHNWQYMYAPLAWTASVTFFHPAICEAVKMPGTPGYPAAYIISKSIK
jgi:hypothetical protein